MSLTVNGVVIPEATGDVIVNGTPVRELVVDGVSVWNKIPERRFIGQGVAHQDSSPNYKMWLLPTADGKGFYFAEGFSPDDPDSEGEIRFDTNHDLPDGQYTVSGSSEKIFTVATNELQINYFDDSGSPVGSVLYDPRTGEFSGESIVNNAAKLTTDGNGGLVRTFVSGWTVESYLTTEEV